MLLVLLGFGVLVILVFASLELNYLFTPVNPGGQVSFSVPQGATAKDIADILYKAGLIKSSLLFRVIAKNRGLDGRLKAGDYILEEGLTMSQIVERLEKGQVSTLSFTVPEGLTVEQAADTLSEKGLVDHDRFLAAARNKDLVKEFLPDDVRIREPLEGYLFPNTYKVRKGSSETEFVRVMAEATKAMYTPDMQGRLASLSLTFHQALTLASIIEREAAYDEERPVMSAVYNNRLRIKMKLDADPTVLYAMGRTSGVLLKKDLDFDSPYNTYKVAGLPPGPIAAPGARSIIAAVNPAPVDYLYFVAKSDRTHVFSKTLAEHNANVRKVQSPPK
jgi:UPF0755 protein